MKFSVMIPVKRNDGSAVPEVEQEDIFRMFWSRFGGCTVDAVADGYWQDDSGKLYIDKVRRVTVSSSGNSREGLKLARRIIRKVGSVLGQKVMYFEHDADGHTEVEFLAILEGAEIDLQQYRKKGRQA